MRKDEKVTCRLSLPETVEAPVKKGQKLGELSFGIGENLIAAYPVKAEKNVQELTYKWYLEKIFHDFFH